MSTAQDPETRRKQLFVLAALCVPLLAMGAVLLERTMGFDLSPAMMKAVFAVIVLIPMIAMGVVAWRTRKDVDELQQRIQSDAAMITQNVTMVAISVLLMGELIFKDAFPMPDFSSLTLGYIWLVIGAGWFSKRRYQ
jgi:hypothetical protein